tara:strand:- start:1120 stop:1461 length:342 start_codon:yes stop_codon:yes gene_type:complete
MTWNWYNEDIIKAEGDILSSLDKKQRKALKKNLQAAEPTEYFGQDFTRLGELLDMMKDLDLIKSDEKLSKKMENMDESNLDILATASKLRKEYETLYRQIRKLVYPKKGGDLR